MRLEEPAADGFEGVALATEGEVPELARVVVAKNEELPGAADARDADVEEVSVAAMEASWGAVRRHREGEMVCLPNLAASADARTASRDAQAVELALTRKFLNHAQVQVGDPAIPRLEQRGGRADTAESNRGLLGREHKRAVERVQVALVEAPLQVERAAVI